MPNTLINRRVLPQRRPRPLPGHLSGLPYSGVLPGLLCEIGAHGGIYSDTGFQTPITNGGTVRRVADLSGNNNYAEVSSTRTWIAAGRNGTPEFTNWACNLRNPQPFDYFKAGYDHSWYFVYDYPYNGTYQTVITKENAGDAGVVYDLAGRTVRGTQTQSANPAHGLKIVGIVHNGATGVTTIRDNGMLVYSGTNTINTLNTTGLWLPYANKFFAAWNVALTPAQELEVVQALSTTFEAGARILCVGNSITQGGYPALTYQALASPRNGYHLHDLGVAGYTWPNLITIAPTTVDVQIQTSTVPLVIIGWEGVNSSNNGLTLQQNKDKTVEWLQGRQAAVAAASKTAQYILATSLPANYWASEPDRLAYNQWLRDNTATYGYILCDVGGDATIGQTGDNANLTYYSDGVHPTAAGHAIIAPYFTTAIETALTALGA